MDIISEELIVLYHIYVEYCQLLTCRTLSAAHWPYNSNTISLHYEKYVAAVSALPVYREERSKRTQGSLCFHDAWHEQNFYYRIHHRHHYHVHPVIYETALIASLYITSAARRLAFFSPSFVHNAA